MGGPELQPAPLSRPGAGARPQIGSAAGTIPLTAPRCPRAQKCTLLHPGILYWQSPEGAAEGDARPGTRAALLSTAARCGHCRGLAGRPAALPALRPRTGCGRPPKPHKPHDRGPWGPRCGGIGTQGRETAGAGRLPPRPRHPTRSGWGFAPAAVGAGPPPRAFIVWAATAAPRALPCHPARPSARGLPGQRASLAGDPCAGRPCLTHRGGRGGRLLRRCSAPPAPCKVVGPLGPRLIPRQRRATCAARHLPGADFISSAAPGDGRRAAPGHLRGPALALLRRRLGRLRGGIRR